MRPKNIGELHKLSEAMEVDGVWNMCISPVFDATEDVAMPVDVKFVAVVVEAVVVEAVVVVVIAELTCRPYDFDRYRAR